MSLESDLFEKFNTKFLLLTGAGASKPLGMPLMRDFYDLVYSKIDDDQREVLRDILLVHAKGKRGKAPDLEALLALIEQYRGFYDILFGDDKFGFPVSAEFRKQVDEWKELLDEKKKEEKKRAAMEAKGLLKTDGFGVPSSSNFPRAVRYQDNYDDYDSYLKQSYSLKQKIGSLDTSLRNLIFEVYGKELDHHKLNELYSPLFDVANKYFTQDFIPVFTTNYDASIETYAIRTDVKLETGFEPMHTGGGLWKSSSRFSVFQPIVGKLNIALFKLHGSLAWHRKDDIIISTGLPVRDPSGYKSAVIYPTQTKEYPDEEPFRTMYDSFKGCLRVAKVAIVIGYSFRDPGIRRIMADALDYNGDLFFILICGQNVDYWKKFAQRNLRSYQIISQCFDFTSNGAPYLKELDKALAGLHT